MSALDDAYDAYLRQLFAQMMQNIAGGEAMQPALEKFSNTAALAKRVKSRAEAMLDQPEAAESGVLAATVMVAENRPTRPRKPRHAG